MEKSQDSIFVVWSWETENHRVTDLVIFDCEKCAVKYIHSKGYTKEFNVSEVVSGGGVIKYKEFRQEGSSDYLYPFYRLQAVEIL